MHQTSLEQSEGKATIADADVVVSGGRGLKGPENWGLIEDLPMYWELLRLVKTCFGYGLATP